MGREAERGPDPMPRRAELTISKRTVDGLSVEAKDAVFWDRELPGFGARVYPSGRKIYVVQSRGPGGSKRITLGRHGELTVEQARKQAVAVIDRIKRGENPVAAPPEPAFTVADLAQRYLEAHVAVNCNAHTRGSTADRSTTTSCRHWERCRSLRLAHRRRRRCITSSATPARGEPCADGAVQDVLVGRGLGAGSGWRQPLPFRAQVQGRHARAVPHTGRVPAVGPGVVFPRCRWPVAGARGGGIAVVVADRVPAQRDSDPAMGRRGPKGSRAAVARHQDGRTDGTADAHRGGGARRSRPRPRSPWVFAGVTPDRHLSQLSTYWRHARGRCGLEDVRIHDARNNELAAA